MNDFLLDFLLVVAMKFVATFGQLFARVSFKVVQTLTFHFSE